jgi:predicted ester cyclase
MYMVRIADGKIVEHWGEENGVTVLRQLGFRIKLEPVEE